MYIIYKIRWGPRLSDRGSIILLIDNRSDQGCRLRLLPWLILPKEDFTFVHNHIFLQYIPPPLKLLPSLLIFLSLFFSFVWWNAYFLNLLSLSLLAFFKTLSLIALSGNTSLIGRGLGLGWSGEGLRMSPKRTILGLVTSSTSVNWHTCRTTALTL